MPCRRVTTLSEPLYIHYICGVLLGRLLNNLGERAVPAVHTVQHECDTEDTSSQHSHLSILDPSWITASPLPQISVILAVAPLKEDLEREGARTGAAQHLTL